MCSAFWNTASAGAALLFWLGMIPRSCQSTPSIEVAWRKIVRVVVEMHHVKPALERGQRRGSLALVGSAVVFRPSRAIEGRVPNDIRRVAQMHHVETAQQRRKRRRGLALLVGDQLLIAAADIHLDDLLAALPADLALAAQGELAKQNVVRIAVGSRGTRRSGVLLFHSAIASRITWRIGEPSGNATASISKGTRPFGQRWLLFVETIPMIRSPSMEYARISAKSGQRSAGKVRLGLLIG